MHGSLYGPPGTGGAPFRTNLTGVVAESVITPPPGAARFCASLRRMRTDWYAMLTFSISVPISGKYTGWASSMFLLKSRRFCVSCDSPPET